MTDATDIAVLMRDMRTLADRIIDAEGENNNGEVGKIIEMYDAADTTFKAQNILLVLNTFEAERQRAEELTLTKENATYEWGEAQSNYDSAKRKIRSLEAELAALKGEQVPVYQMYYDGFWRDVDKEHYEHFKEKGSDVRLLFTAPQKPIVLPQAHKVRAAVTLTGDERIVMIPCNNGNWLSRFDVEHAIKMAGGIVKVTDKCHPSLMESVTVPHNVIGTYEDASGGRSDIVTLSDKREMKDMSSIVKDGD